MAVEAWFRRHGFENDPLDIRPSAEIVSRDSETCELRRNIAAGNIAVLSGDLGMGKTSVLKALEREFRQSGEYRPLFFSMLDSAGGNGIVLREGLPEKFLASLGLIKPKKKVLLVDEADIIKFDDGERLRALYDSGKAYAIVLSRRGSSAINFSEALEHRVGERIELRGMDKAELLAILNLRLGRNNPLHMETAERIAEFSEGNPRRFLINCKKVCMRIHELGEDAEKALLKEFEAHAIGGSARENGKSAGSRLSPLQAKMLGALSKGPLNLRELAHLSGTSVGTVGKQVSILTLRAKKEYMERKGITKLLIVKNKESLPTTYALSAAGQRLCSSRR